MHLIANKSIKIKNSCFFLLAFWMPHSLPSIGDLFARIWVRARIFKICNSQTPRTYYYKPNPNGKVEKLYLICYNLIACHNLASRIKSKRHRTSERAAFKPRIMSTWHRYRTNLQQTKFCILLLLLHKLATNFPQALASFWQTYSFAKASSLQALIKSSLLLTASDMKMQIRRPARWNKSLYYSLWIKHHVATRT